MLFKFPCFAELVFELPCIGEWLFETFCAIWYNMYNVKKRED